MNFKNLFKFALSSLLLSGSLAVFADDNSGESGDASSESGTTTSGPVTLANGAGSVTWSQFVDVITGKIAVTGNIADLPAANEALIAYNEADEALTKANEDLEAVQGEDSEVSKTLSSATLTKNNAVGDTVTSFTTLGQMKKAYDEVLEDLDNLISDSTANRNEIIRLQGLIDGYNRNATSYNTQISILQGQLEDIGSTTTIVTTYPDWLTKDLTNANLFYNNFLNLLDEEEYTDMTVYCRFASGSGSLYIAYQNPAPGVTNYTPVKISTFKSYIAGLKRSTFEGVQAIRIVGVYFGQKEDGTYNYTAAGVTNGIMTKSGTFGDELEIADVAKTLVTTLTTTGGYYTSKTETVYDDPDQAATIQGKIKDYRSKLASLNTQIETTNGQIQTLTATNAGLKTQIENFLTNNEYLTAKSNYDTALETHESKVKIAKQAIADYEKAKKDYDDAVAAEYAKVEKATTDLESARKVAQTAANQQARENYNSITLTADIDATEAIGTDYAGDIYADGHVINISDGIKLFNKFSGVVDEAAINGTLANTILSQAHFSDVAVWTGSEGRFYDGDGAKTNFNSIGALGFVARTKFGVDFATNQLVTLDQTTKVYSVTVTNPATPTATAKPYYATNDGTKLITTGGEAVTVPVNAFIKSETTDLTGINNVYANQKNSEGEDYWVSEKVVITDKNAFYCPVQIDAKEVEYTRTIKEGYNVACLPFELSVEDCSDLSYVCTYQKEDQSTFWFTAVNKAEANKPLLLVGNEGAAELTINLNKAQNIIEATPNTNQIIEGGADGEKTKSYGLFRTTLASEIRGGSETAKVYGLNNNGKFQAAMSDPNGTDVKFSPFRMVIWSALNLSPEQANAPRRIGILDENGKEINIGGIVTGIDEVESSAAALDIRGGHGEIIITSETELGQVEVYALDGRLAAIANVDEGTTSVNVANGLYIVMGKKVIVK